MCRILRVVRGLSVLLTFAYAVRAAESGGTGTIEGRINSPTNGEYLERARITVEGTALEAFSDSSGYYRLTNAPAGMARIRTFYTGFPAHTSAVTVFAGQTVALDVTLAARLGAPQEGEAVKLDNFVVSSSREMSAAAIAINEQRFAANIKTVASTDEFGAVSEGSVGEFLKFMPGVSVAYEAGALARDISINGVSSEYVPVMVNGFNLASARGASVVGRGAQMDMTSITATSRIEVTYSPTPESPGMALGGSINMVPRSAFERSRPEFKVNTSVTMRDNARDLGKTPGPWDGYSRKVRPGFDFSYIKPVSKNFGFTLAGGHSDNGTEEQFIQNTWRGVSAATNGTAFPHTTSDQPYLTSTQVRDGTKKVARSSIGGTIDWRFSPNDRLSFSYQHYFNDFLVINHAVTYNITGVRPGDFSPKFTRGAPGQGNVQQFNTYRDRTNSTASPSLVWRHNGPVWTLEAGAGMSRARGTLRAVDKGYFSDVTAQRTGVTIAFEDIFYLRPNRITVTDAAGTAPVDATNINNYAITTLTSNPVTTYDIQTGLNASAQREFAWRVPLTLKTGLDFRQDERDQQAASFAYNYVGADGRGSTTPVGNDDSAGPFFAPIYSERDTPFGFPKMQWFDNVRLWSHYQRNPTHLTLSENAKYLSETNGSKHAKELISAAYVRGDLHFLDRRLKIVGGVRGEQTNVEAEGPLTDRTRNFQRDASGRVIDSNLALAGVQPVPIVPASDALGVSRLTVIDRGAKVDKEYLRWFPSVNVSYNVRENLIARGSYSQSIGRPSFDQYAGGITLPDEALGPSATNRISVNNAGIKPWSSKSVSTRLEYYFAGIGLISVGAYRRDFENFFGQTTFNATPEFLALYALDANTYSSYEVATQTNLTTRVRMTGADISYKQALTFLPRWARGLNVFGNAAVQRSIGEASANFNGYIPRRLNGGLALVRDRFSLRVNFSHQSKNRLGEITGASIGPGTFNWRSSQTFQDVLGEYALTKRFAVYFTLRNIKDTPDQREVEGPLTPKEAQFRSREQGGSLWTFGVRGTF